VRELLWNFGVTDGVDLPLGELTGVDRPAVAALQSGIFFRRQ
jgi:hypothetical protein